MTIKKILFAILGILSFASMFFVREWKETGKIGKALSLVLSLVLFIFGLANFYVAAPDEITRAAAEFSDTFTEESHGALESHMPDVGTGWTEIIDVGLCALWINNDADNVDAAYAQAFGGCYTSEGSLVQTDDVMSSADYIVQILQVDGDNLDDVNILACRIQDSNNMYALRWNEDSSDLYKKVGGNWSTIDTNGGAVADGSIVELICDGTSISVEDDDVEILSAIDDSHTSAGRAGMGMGAVILVDDDVASQNLDNFEVNIIGAAPPEERRIIKIE